MVFRTENYSPLNVRERKRKVKDITVESKIFSRLRCLFFFCFLCVDWKIFTDVRRRCTASVFREKVAEEE
jgi:hypothetical protein